MKNEKSTIKKLGYQILADEMYDLPSGDRKIHLKAQQREDGAYLAVQVTTSIPNVSGHYTDEAIFPDRGILKLPVDGAVMMSVSEAFAKFAGKLKGVETKTNRG